MRIFQSIIMLIISTQVVFAQNKGEQIIQAPLRDSVIFFVGEINANPSLSVDQLYQQVRHWAMTKMTAPPISSPILYENPKEGLISARMVLNTIRYSAQSSEYYLSAQGVVYFQVTPGILKYTITDFYYNLEDITKISKYLSEGDSKKLLLRATSEELGKVIRKEYTHYLNEINSKVNIKLISLEKFISKPITGGNTWQDM